MKLKCKIKNKYLEQILRGEKKIEYRQIESIIFVDEQGKEYEFRVTAIQQLTSFGEQDLKRKYPDVSWDDDLPTIAIELGGRIK